MARKGDANSIIPCCTRHHREMHYVGAKTFAMTYRLDYERLAATVEKHWRAHAG